MPLTNNNQQQKQLQIPTPQQTQNSFVQKTPYQQNVANVQPKQNNDWFKGTYPTTSEIYGRVYQMWQKDPNMASQVMAGFSQAQQDSSSPWYNPYTQPTNRAVNVLQSYGIDTNTLTDEWFQQNTSWQQSLRYGNTTNTPLAPTAKATPDQIVAFNLYQYQYSEPTTKKAEQEWEALKQELTYKATRKDRNYSDDEIINSIDWNKYGTLKAMNEGKTKGAVTELNRAVDFSDDEMRGVLWAARNGGSTGNSIKDMAMYGLGEGNKWVENPEMQAKLAWGNPETYSPYQVGMTLDEEVGMYFNVPYIDRQTLNRLRTTIDDSDKTSMSMFNRAAKSVDNAEKAQEQRNKLYAWIDKNIGNKSEEWLLKNLDVKLGNKDYAMLKAMDESIDNGSDLVQMGTAVDYRKQDVIDYIRRKKAELGGNGTAPDIANGTAGSAKTKEQVEQEAEDIVRRNRIKDQEYTGTEKDAYDSVYGEGAYQRDIAAAESLTSQSQAQKDSDQYVNDTVGDIEDDLTPGESSRLNGYSGASDQAQQTVKANKDAMVSGEESPEAIIQKNNEEITKGWIEGTVDIYPRTIKYEQTQANLDFAKKQIEEINAKLGDKVFAGQTQDTSFTMEINGDLYRITLSPDLSEIEGIDNVNKSDMPVPVYASFGLYDSPEEYDADTQIWDAVEKSGQVEAFREKYAQETEKINAANKLEITDEDRELMNLKRQYEIQVEDNEQYLRDYKNQYDADITVFKRLSERRAAHIQNLKDMGASTTEVETADAALTALTGFSEYEATKWDKYNPTYQYSLMIADGEDKQTVLDYAAAEHEEILEQIKDVEWLIDYCDRHNIKIGNDVRNNMNRRIAKLQRDVQDYEYFKLQWSDDFEEEAKKARSQEYENRYKTTAIGIPLPTKDMTEEEYYKYVQEHSDEPTTFQKDSLVFKSFGLSNLMTEEEKNTWYYLKAKDEENGTNKSDEYLNFLADPTYGVLNVRNREKYETMAAEETGNGVLGFIKGNAGAVMLAPSNAILSTVYRIDTWVNGSEISPYHPDMLLANTRASVRQQSAKEIQEKFAKPIIDEKTGEVTGYEDTVLSKIMQGAYDMVSNRLDSMANAMAFGPLFNWVGGNAFANMAKEFLSASPMGMSAAMEAASRAKEKGASDWQASWLGFWTFAAETITEAISIENIQEAMSLGSDVTASTYKDFLKHWLTKAGISEMAGESINDIVENFADEKLMGELSEFQENVYQYRLAGYDKDEATLMARKDQIAGVIRTAVISYLTPGLDVFSFSANRLKSYGEMTKTLNAQNPDNKLTVRQVRKQIIDEQRSEARKQREKIQKQKQDAHEPGEIDYDALEERYNPQGAEERKAAIAAEEEAKAKARTAEEEAKVREGKQNTIDFEILETAKTYDKAGKSAAIAAVLDEGSTQDETDTANAASVRIDKVLGQDADPSGELQDLLLGAKVTDKDIATSTIKQGIMYAALGGEQSQSRQVVQSDAYQKATPAVKATMLAEAAQQDAQNPDIMKNVANAVREDRIAKQMGVLMANGAAEKIGQAEVKVDFAKLETQKAQKSLDTQRGVEKAAREKQQSMVAESVQNPNNKQMAQDAENAMRDLIDQAKVTREYEQSVKNAQQREDDAVRNADKVRQKTLSDIRKQAEQIVAQEDQQRAAVAEQQRVEQEQQAVVAEQQRVAEEEKSNAVNAEAENFIEKNLPNGTEEDKQKVREMFKKVSTETPTQEARDENGNLTATAILNRGKVLQRISKKFDIRIDEEDTSRGGIVARQNGYYDARNNRIVIDQNTSLSDAMFFVLGHELTHVAEKSSTYKDLANALLKIAYGDGADYDTVLNDAKSGKPTSRIVADIIARKALYDQRLAKMHQQDNNINGNPISYEDALQEVVADITGKLLNGNQELIDQLASKEPRIARRIIDSIKSFIRKARGIDGEWKTNARKTVDLLEKALKEAEKKNGNTKYSIDETTTLVTDENGDSVVSELPDGAVVSDYDYSLSSWTDAEKQTVREALLKKGFSEEQVDKWIADVNDIATMIASDRDRLDYKADPLKTMLKPNSDYIKTLDASTLCAKRLLYQGTFNAIQHALPNTPLMPTDLIGLMNMMKESGYEAPCDICYVESRRRNLGKYAQEFIDGYTGEYKPTIEELTTTDGLEELRKAHPQAYKDFNTAMSKKMFNNPKVVQLRTDYRGDIRKMSAKEKQGVIDIGGLRVQSFSDFETPHLIDMMQAVLDMAAENLTAQAYTKVPNFAWVFGDTGIKINLSLIGEGTGLDENGQLVFSSTEGMDFEEAMRLRERYGKNVGTILVGMNDAHILAAMADDRIDFIIPFHKSGWTQDELDRMPTLSTYENYENDQREKQITGYTKDGKPKMKNVERDFAPVGQKRANGKGRDGYWDFTKSGKENAQIYLDMCAADGRVPKFSKFLVDKGDGSFALQPDGSTDGYWKLLIDFKMYDNEGNGAEQQTVTPNVNMDQAIRVLNEYKGGADSLPVAQPIVDRFVEEYKASHPLDETRLKYSLPEGEQNAIVVRDGKKETGETVDFIAKMLDGEKLGETRKNNKGLSTTQWLGLSKEGGVGKDVLGRVWLGKPREITKYEADGKTLTQDYKDAMIEGTQYDIGPDETTWFYPILKKEDFRDNPKKIVRSGNYSQYRYSLPVDAPYMAAVERGKMGEAQRMVDEAAEKAGYIYGKVYHGTPNKEFTEFKDGFVFFTSNKDTADEYQNPGQMWATHYDKGRTIGAYIKLDNPLILDNSYSDYRNEHTPWQEWKPTVYGRVPDNAMNAQEVAERAKELGYDGVIIRNDKDTKWADSDKYLKKRGRGDTVIAFSAEQIKSSDPITYDDQGRVIPLSERFDTGKKDIRYSLPSDDILEQQIRYYLQNEGDTVYDHDEKLVKDGILKRRQLNKMNKTDVGEGTRAWGTGMAQRMDELADQARQFVLDHSAYQRDTNKAQIDRAVSWVKQLPTQGEETIYDKAVRYVTSEAFRKGESKTADGRAKLAVVMGMAVGRNDASAQILIADMTNKTATNVAQALQAQKLLKLMTPEGRIGTLQRMLDDQKLQLQRRGKNAVAENLKFSDWVIRAAGVAETESEMKQVRDAALNELAKQIPMNWKDRLTSFRMLSMLFNPRTHIRNIVGNALFVPAIGIKNKLSAIAEAMTLEKGKRTKTLAPILNKSIREFARQDAVAMKDVLTGEAKYNESGSLVGRQQKGLSKINGDFLEKEDWLFLKGHYRRALGGWMQANGYTVEDVKNDHQLLAKGREYAVEEAQKATYRDFSKTADALNKISKQGGALGFVVDAALPFKKTPINILRRGIEYSPIGIAKGLKNLMFHMNEYTQYQQQLEDYEAGKTETAPVMPDKAVSPNQVIDQICSGLTGTGIMALGFLLAGTGAVTCSLDDDDDKFEKAKGGQEYSIKLFGTDVSMTIDWAAPMCMPFFVGAAIRDQVDKENLDIEDVLNAMGGITEPVFNLSMLDGVNSLLKTNSYDQTNPIEQIGSKLALNYAGSYVPSVLGAITRTFFDDTQRKSFVEGDKKGLVSNALYTHEQAQNKIPFYSKENIAARNIWGKEKTSDFAERLIENFISPGYFNKVENDPIINEMARLYDVTGDNKMIPDEDPDKKITFTKDKVKREIVLTDKQWDEYKKVRGQTAKNELTELLNSETYQNATDAARVQMIKDIWSHADKVGKNAVTSDFEIEDKTVAQIAKDSKLTGYESEMVKALNTGDYSTYDDMAEAIRQEYDDEEEADSEIRQKLMNYYREMYKKAYRRGGEEGQVKMAEIEEALEYTGLVDDTDFMKWQNAVDNET